MRKSLIWSRQATAESEPIFFIHLKNRLKNRSLSTRAGFVRMFATMFSSKPFPWFWQTPEAKFIFALMAGEPQAEHWISELKIRSRGGIVAAVVSLQMADVIPPRPDRRLSQYP